MEERDAIQLVASLINTLEAAIKNTGKVTDMSIGMESDGTVFIACSAKASQATERFDPLWWRTVHDTITQKGWLIGESNLFANGHDMTLHIYRPV